MAKSFKITDTAKNLKFLTDKKEVLKVKTIDFVKKKQNTLKKTPKVSTSVVSEDSDNLIQKVDTFKSENNIIANSSETVPSDTVIVTDVIADDVQNKIKDNISSELNSKIIKQESNFF